MSERIYVAYCTSGLGNRLRPLASAIAYCQLTGRQLKVYWDNITPNGCLTPLKRLFNNSFVEISLEDLSLIGDCASSVVLCTEKGPGHGVQREADRFGRNQLLRLAERHTPRHSQDLQLDESADIVIVYDNNFLDCVPREKSVNALRGLTPTNEVRSRVLGEASKLGLWSGPDESWQPLIGVHARGTDFGLKEAVELYSNMIRDRIGNQKFFLSTEDPLLEKGLKRSFPEQVISRSERLHLILNEGKTHWNEPDSYTISEEHGLDALTDIYLLSCVDLRVFHPGSTFAEVARCLHGVMQKSQDALSREKLAFLDKARGLVPRGSKVTHKLEIDTGENGPKPPEETSAAFMFWETLGYQIPFMERLFMNSYSGQPALTWDGQVFDQLAAIPFEQFPMELFDRICPYKEAWSQMAVLRSYIKGRRVLIIGSETFWLELLCVLANAGEITTVEYRPIHWTQSPSAGVLKTLTWDEFTNDLDKHQSKYDLILSYSSLEHSGLGRYGDRITALGDLFTFQLMSHCLTPNGLCAVAVPTGQDLTHFNAHRIYGEKRIRALQHVSNLNFIGIAGPDKNFLASDANDQLKSGWTLQALAQLPLGQYRQPCLCFSKKE